MTVYSRKPRCRRTLPFYSICAATRALRHQEGCASGDCGACTVVIAEPQGEALRYTPINACLTFMSALQGKQLITVEDLKHRGDLHSVQQAMVDHHASQCGFCTPGFVMSLFALQKIPSSSGFQPRWQRAVYRASGCCRRCPATFAAVPVIGQSLTRRTLPVSRARMTNLTIMKK